jgi:Phage integrase family
VSGSRKVRAAGVREVRFHDLRHTFGARMAAVGVPMRTFQEWMGHADFKTTLIYADYSPDERRERDLVARTLSSRSFRSRLAISAFCSSSTRSVKLRIGATRLASVEAGGFSKVFA